MSRSKSLPIRQIQLKRLKPYPKNPRKHSDYDIDKIAASIRLHGFADPIETNSDLLICAGHGRYFAAQKMGLAEVAA